MNDGISAAGEAAQETARPLPDCVEVETGGDVDFSVIWLHGLGADGHDFEPIVPMLGMDRVGPSRFVFPHAPRRPVTINGGMVMRAWYDIRGVDVGRDQDRQGILASAEMVEALIEREITRGIEPGRIVLAGFSQGGAIAAYTGIRHAQALGGLMLLSCYPLFEDRVAAEFRAVQKKTPVFAGHGRLDPMVPVAMGRRLAQMLQSQGMPVEWHEYDIPHSVAPEEIADISAWLVSCLGGDGGR
ncbi:MAG: alpha/beta hydrolase [Xanthomonadales bacterium]|nr:alpha/beta hydrolase [Gammaproteobacteria bacterium]NNL94750.1 alpha/beta hydrolase [Xanthomonadales bacterium]